MAQRMFLNHGLPPDVFYTQRLVSFLRMQGAAEPEVVYFIDEL